MISAIAPAAVAGISLLADLQGRRQHLGRERLALGPAEAGAREGASLRDRLVALAEIGQRVELHDSLALTGAEVSVNSLPSGAGVPFVHSHKHNEEIYGILSGKGKAVIDGEEISLAEGDWLRVAPAARRQFSAAEDSGISFVCIQVREGSLEAFTAGDAIIH